jgi:ABC-type transporter Mla MlaB component
MLKITIQKTAEETVVVLEGRLCGACAAEAERSWRSALADAGTRRIAVDLVGVSYVDSDGESLLMEMLAHGASVRVGGVWIGHLIEDLQRRIVQDASTNSRRAPRRLGSPGVS